MVEMATQLYEYPKPCSAGHFGKVAWYTYYISIQLLFKKGKKERKTWGSHRFNFLNTHWG